MTLEQGGPDGARDLRTVRRRGLGSGRHPGAQGEVLHVETRAYIHPLFGLT